MVSQSLPSHAEIVMPSRREALQVLSFPGPMTEDRLRGVKKISVAQEPPDSVTDDQRSKLCQLRVTQSWRCGFILSVVNLYITWEQAVIPTRRNAQHSYSYHEICWDKGELGPFLDTASISNAFVYFDSQNNSVVTVLKES